MFNKNTMNTNPDFKYKNTHPNFLALSCPFLSNKHKNINTKAHKKLDNQWTQGSEELHL